jgi:hypothetical protein
MDTSANSLGLASAACLAGAQGAPEVLPPAPKEGFLPTPTSAAKTILEGTLGSFIFLLAACLWVSEGWNH